MSIDSYEGGGEVFAIFAPTEVDCFQPARLREFPPSVHVLHAFKKKSKRGIATPKSELELIERRLRVADADNAERVK
jgi:hypothetical protein